MSCPVGFFMGKGRIIAFRVLEKLERRHFHIVFINGIESLIAAVLDNRARVSEKLLGMVEALHGIERRGLRRGVVMRG